MILNFVYFAAGLAILYFGGEWLVDGSGKLARKFQIRPFIIGAVVIGFGTSAPEAFVSVMAQVKGSSGLSFGNIVGSSIANIGLILGLVALVGTIEIDKCLAKQEYPFLFLITLILVVLAFGKTLLQWHAAVLLGFFILFLGWSLRSGMSEEKGKIESETSSNVKLILRILFGIAFLLVGSELLVRSGVVIARAFGVSEVVIGTSLIAVGTSLPELAAGLIAASKRESGLVLGNIMGSNVFNLAFVSGLALLIRPIPIGPEVHQLLLPALIIFTLFLYPIFKSGKKLGRKAGVFLLIFYAIFMVFLFAFRHSA